MREDLLKKLMLFGLNQYEAKAYMALVLRGTATASELSDISGVPYTRVYDVLSSLESKGFVVTIPGKPIRYRAIHPKQALEGVRKLIEEEYQNKLKELDIASRDLLEYLTPLYEKAPPGVKEALIFIRGRLSIENIFFLLLEESSSEIFLILTPNTLLRFINHEPSLTSIFSKRKKTKFKLIVLGNYLPVKIEAENVDVKLVDMKLNIGVAIVNETVLIFESIPDDLTSSSPYDNGFMVKNSSFANFIKALAFSVKPT